jgi:membrane-bound metal-dependent hydrolase YbcI (DUF457 family)
MRAKEHIAGGVIATTAAYILTSVALGQPISLEGLLSAAVIGVPTGLLLDLLEPATHPGHRAVCHSHAAAGGLALLANSIWIDPLLAPSAKVWGMTLLAGVGSHHVLDATTTSGLPLTGLKWI